MIILAESAEQGPTMERHCMSIIVYQWQRVVATMMTTFGRCATSAILGSLTLIYEIGIVNPATSGLSLFCS